MQIKPIKDYSVIKPYPERRDPTESDAHVFLPRNYLNKDVPEKLKVGICAGIPSVQM